MDVNSGLMSIYWPEIVSGHSTLELAESKSVELAVK